MTERSVFLAALEYDDPAERSAYLDVACAGEPALRAEVEQLLTAHEQSGSFMVRPAPERLAGDLAPGPEAEGTRTLPTADGAESLDFLEPSDKTGSIGRLGHYEVQEVVGRGGMGVVLRAFDERLHRVVAIKVIAAQLATSASARRRFAREARAAAAVSHDHVVTIHAVEEGDRLPYIVMQYVAGASLQERLDRSGPPPLAEILRIGMQTASGLAAAHAQGLVHRDVKPANILLENGVERVKLSDFGLARAADDANLTQTGTVAGTPSFMSPEQAEGKSVDHRSDLFSLGSVLYAMCTGRPPFRASTSMGVLKRVCEETPKPIRETNAEIPDWLVAVVEKLHAKDPAARFQLAAEVAEMLGRHLAHVQHPSVVPLPAVAKPAEPAPARRARHKGWAVAAAVLVAVVAALGTTEATGLTNVRATVIRIFTPEGTLIVETDDPAVKVVVEGDGDLVITGAGPQEVRLRAGNYRLWATKDGKPVKLDRDLVTITRGEREIVRVRLEGDAPAAVVPTRERAAFVLLGGKGVAERKFDTLAEAVQGASDGDTIEVRGNGPFVTKPITIEHIGLVIRAGQGFRPVVTVDPAETQHFLIRSTGALFLEGLDLQWVTTIPPAAPPGLRNLVISFGPQARLHAANCRFLMKRPFDPDRLSVCVSAWQTPQCQLRNCQCLVVGQGMSVQFDGGNNGRIVLDNCLIHGPGLQINVSHAKPRMVILRKNTLVRGLSMSVYLGKIDSPLGEPPTPPIEMEMSGNVLASPVLNLNQSAEFLKKEKVLDARLSELLLKKLVSWRGSENLFPLAKPLLNIAAEKKTFPFTPSVTTLDDWKVFWGLEELAGRLGQARFQGGDLVAKAATTPELVTPADFRLCPGPGYKADKAGNDLGANVDLVGPGDAYHRWTQTPEYQTWLKDSKQVK